MLQAMNTGHEGSVSTGHANSTHELITRLGNLLMTDRQMQPEAARFQVAMAIDLIIGLSRPGGVRKVTAISEVCISPDGYRINDIFTYDYINNILIRTGEMVDTGKFDRYE
jgi:pilus assembly protein CpaF